MGDYGRDVSLPPTNIIQDIHYLRELDWSNILEVSLSPQRMMGGFSLGGGIDLVGQYWVRHLVSDISTDLVGRFGYSCYQTKVGCLAGFKVSAHAVGSFLSGGRSIFTDSLLKIKCAALWILPSISMETYK